MIFTVTVTMDYHFSRVTTKVYNILSYFDYFVFGRPTFVTSDSRRSLTQWRWRCFRKVRLVAVMHGEYVRMAVMVSRPPRIRSAVCGQSFVQVLEVLITGYSTSNAGGQQIR
uniref:Uncharacterized protein n=1 Tax=Schizaphis graminum TaxID=13262 RepID=A0A2S2PCX9_SCHGA